MKLTKFTHSCVRLEKDGAVLVIDPGTFSERETGTETALAGAHALLITHQHADHFDEEKVVAALQLDQSLLIYAPAKVTGMLAERLDADGLDRVHTAEPEQQYSIAGFEVQTFGGQHALIHPHIPMVANIGYLIDGSLYHPGDSFTVPHGVDVSTVLVPVHAPWSKTAEVIDFVTSVRAARAFQIHDALLNETGVQLVEGHVARIGGLYGTEFRHLALGESVMI